MATLKVRRLAQGSVASGAWLLLLAGLLCVVGVAFIESASYQPESGTYAAFGAKQRLFLLPALLAFFALGFMPFRWLTALAVIGYAAAIALLVGLPFFGQLSNGARSWYRLGPLAFQPAEVAKLACVLLLGRVFAHARCARAWWGPLVPALIFGPAFLLIALQPDLGSAIVLIPPALGMLLVAGVRKRVLVAIVLGGLATVPVALWTGSLEKHQVERIESFVHPERDPLGKGFQAIQSKIAIGAGGAFGQGYRQGSQTQLGYLPDSHTDFVFSVVVEEGGFALGTLVLLLQLTLGLSLLGLAAATRSPAGRLVITGVALVHLTQVTINVAMTAGLFPVTGITLPLLSYGGSSLVVSFAALGLAWSASRCPGPTAAPSTDRPPAGRGRLLQRSGDGARGFTLGRRGPKAAPSARRPNRRVLGNSLLSNRQRAKR